MGDLDFDTDGDGRTHTAGVGDSGDDYYNAGAGWAPIGGHGETTHQAFTAVFDGNDNDIENLYLNLETDAANAGTYRGPVRRPHGHGPQCGPGGSLCQKRA